MPSCVFTIFQTIFNQFFFKFHTSVLPHTRARMLNSKLKNETKLIQFLQPNSCSRMLIDLHFTRSFIHNHIEQMKCAKITVIACMWVCVCVDGACERICVYLDQHKLLNCTYEFIGKLVFASNVFVCLCVRIVSFLHFPSFRGVYLPIGNGFSWLRMRQTPTRPHTVFCCWFRRSFVEMPANASRAVSLHRTARPTGEWSWRFMMCMCITMHLSMNFYQNVHCILPHLFISLPHGHFPIFYLVLIVIYNVCVIHDHAIIIRIRCDIENVVIYLNKSDV